MAVSIALTVASARGGDTVGGEALGDGEIATSGEVLLEDPLDDRRRHRIGVELVQPLAIAGLLRIGVRAHVSKAVTIRGSAAEEPSLHLRLRAHGRPYAGLDPRALTLRHATEEHHHQIVGLGAGVDGPPTSGTHIATP